MLAAHLRLDPFDSVSSSGYLVNACYGYRGNTSAIGACIYGCSFLWTECKHAVGHRHGIGQVPLDRGFPAAAFGLASTKRSPSKVKLQIERHPRYTTDYRQSGPPRCPDC